MCSADYVGEKTILHLSGSRAAALWLRQSIARHNAALKILYFEILRDRGLVQTVPQGRIKGGGTLGKCQGPRRFFGSRGCLYGAICFSGPHRTVLGGHIIYVAGRWGTAF